MEACRNAKAPSGNRAIALDVHTNQQKSESDAPQPSPTLPASNRERREFDVLFVTHLLAELEIDSLRDQAPHKPPGGSNRPAA